MNSNQANQLHTASFYPILALAIALLCGCGGGGSGSDRVWFADANSPQVDNLQLVTAIGQPVSGHVTGRDIDGDSLAFFLIDEPSNGEVVGLPPGPGPKEAGSDSGFFTYTPDSGFVGEDRFRFIANDGDWNSRHGAVVIDVRPPGFVGIELKSSEAIAAGGELSDKAWSGRWFPVIHPLPRDERALFLVDLDGIVESPLVFRSDKSDRISNVLAVPALDGVLFRAGARLYLWRWGDIQPVAIDFPLGGAPIILGEVTLSGDGSMIAVIAGRRDEPGLHLFMSRTENTYRVSRVDLGLSGPVLIRGLVFAGAVLKADLYRWGSSARCELSVTLPVAELADSIARVGRECSE